MARSEYSRIRGVVMKRLERLEKAGLTLPGIQIPKVSELKTPEQKKAALSSLQKFLSAPDTTVRGAKQSGKKIGPSLRGGAAPVALSEKQQQGRARRERERPARQARKDALKNLTPQQRGLIKGARKLGVNVPTKDIGTFVEYMEFRLSQSLESEYYIFANYVEDFEKMAEKHKHSTMDIMKDFNRFVSDNRALIESVEQTPGYTESYVQGLWDDLISGM